MTVGVYLVDFFLGVCEQGREVAQGVTVQHHLCLFVCASHNVPHCTQCCSLEKQKGSLMKTFSLINKQFRFSKTTAYFPARLFCMSDSWSLFIPFSRQNDELRFIPSSKPLEKVRKRLFTADIE